jgi:hypothetical protein
LRHALSSVNAHQQSDACDRLEAFLHEERAQWDKKIPAGAASGLSSDARRAAAGDRAPAAHLMRRSCSSRRPSRACGEAAEALDHLTLALRSPTWVSESSVIQG